MTTNNAIPFQRSDAQPFLSTPTAMAIWNGLHLTHRRRSLGGIFGEAGIGKTSTVLAYARENPGVRVLNTKGQVHTSIQLTDALCRLVGISNNRYSDMFTQIRRIMGEGSLLIIDESQSLADNAIEMVRFLNDPLDGKDRFGIALVGNPVVIGKREGEHRALNGQFLSRLRPRLMFRASLAEDYEAIFDHHKIPGARARARIKKTADVYGALRAASYIIEEARELAGTTKSVELSHIEEAIALLGYQ